MFDLAQAIVKWRQEMLAAGIKTPVPLEELESHLREEIEEKVLSGMSQEQAFAIAVGRIGQGKELNTEFARGGGLRSLLEMELVSKQWDLKWGPVLLCVLFTGVALFFGSLAVFKFGSFADATLLQRMSCLGATVVSYLLFISGLVGWKIFPVIPNKRTRDTITIGCAVVVSLSVMIFLARVNVGMQQFFVEFAWAFFVPFGALGGWILGIERAAQQKTGTAGS